MPSYLWSEVTDGRSLSKNPGTEFEVVWGVTYHSGSARAADGRFWGTYVGTQTGLLCALPRGLCAKSNDHIIPVRAKGDAVHWRMHDESPKKVSRGMCPHSPYPMCDFSLSLTCLWGGESPLAFVPILATQAEKVEQHCVHPVSNASIDAGRIAEPQGGRLCGSEDADTPPPLPLPNPPPPHRPSRTSPPPPEGPSAKGGGLFVFQTPPPPPDPSKVFEPVFLQFEILGERVGAKGAEVFSLPFMRGYIFFFTLCLYTQILRILWRIQKCLKNTESFLTPDLTSGSDLG